MNGEEEQYMSGGKTLFAGKPLAHLHKVYICGEIRNPEEYVDVFELIRNADQNDTVCIHINSPGGNAFTAVQFLRVLNDTRATVIASVEGLCMSAATLIFMAARHHEVTNHSVFMFHNYASRVEGKGGEMKDAVLHHTTWGEELFRDVYAEFLTKEEIQQILNGKDLYMTSRDVVKRLEKRNQVILKLAEKSAKPERKPRKPTLMVASGERATV